MHHRFWQTMASFEREAARLTRTLGQARAQMQEIRSQTADVIVQSRTLMREVDDLMAGDPWREQSARNQDS